MSTTHPIQSISRRRRAGVLVTGLLGVTAVLGITTSTSTSAQSPPTPNPPDLIPNVQYCLRESADPLAYRQTTLGNELGVVVTTGAPVIPAFVGIFNGKEIHFPGRNLGVVRAADGLTGAHLLATGCAVPPVGPPLGAPPTSAAVATPIPVPGDPVPTPVPTPTTGVPATSAPAPGAPGPGPTPTTGVPTPTPPTPGGPTPTLAPDPTSPTPPDPGPGPTPTTGVPTPTPPTPGGPTPTLAPDPTSPTPPDPGPGPTPTTGVPTPTPPTPGGPTPTLAPATTAPNDCPAGELSHDGRCFAIPPLVLPDPVVVPSGSQAAGSVTPIVECVDVRADGVRVVWFGYESTAATPITIAGGADNAVSPRGTPPTLFGPGLHIFTFDVETADGVASWTLDGTTATSGPDSPSCAQPTSLTPATTIAETPTSVAQGTPSTVAGTTDTTDPDTTDTTDPDTTEPGTTDPGTTAPTTGGCAAGERDIDGTCSAVEPVRLVLVDNVMECDGHAVARFAAFNDNTFALDGEDVTSLVSPQRLALTAPEVINERDVVSDDGSETAAIFTVRYVNAVTWSVAHDGIQASVSAGVNGASANDECPQAATNVTGQSGLLQAPGTGAAPTGASNSLPMAVLAALLGGLGLLLIAAARRRTALSD